MNEFQLSDARNTLSISVTGDYIQTSQREFTLRKSERLEIRIEMNHFKNLEKRRAFNEKNY